MGGSLRKSAGTRDSSSLATGGGGGGEGGEGGDEVTALPASTQQALAQDRADAAHANARLKEKKRAAAAAANAAANANTSSTSSAHASTLGMAETASTRRREKKHRSSASVGATASERERRSKSEPKWNKPPAAAVVAAALRDEDAEVETIDIGHSFAQTASTKSARTSGHNDSASFGGVVPGGSAGGAHGPPAALVNPWSRSSVFERDFRSESADAELFVRLARDQTKIELKKERKRQKSSIIQAASQTHLHPREDEDDAPLTPRGEAGDEDLA